MNIQLVAFGLLLIVFALIFFVIAMNPEVVVKVFSGDRGATVKTRRPENADEPLRNIKAMTTTRNVVVVGSALLFVTGLGFSIAGALGFRLPRGDEPIASAGTTPLFPPMINPSSTTRPDVQLQDSVAEFAQKLLDSSDVDSLRGLYEFPFTANGAEFRSADDLKAADDEYGSQFLLREYSLGEFGPLERVDADQIIANWIVNYRLTRKDGSLACGFANTSVVIRELADGNFRAVSRSEETTKAACP